MSTVFTMSSVPTFVIAVPVAIAVIPTTTVVRPALALLGGVAMQRSITFQGGVKLALDLNLEGRMVDAILPGRPDATLEDRGHV